MGSSRNSYQYNNFQPKVDSNPIAPRVRHPLHAKVCPEAFPIKASGNPEVISADIRKFLEFSAEKVSVAEERTHTPKILPDTGVIWVQ
jgi:hypothetical protein